MFGIRVMTDEEFSRGLLLAILLVLRRLWQPNFGAGSLSGVKHNARLNAEIFETLVTEQEDVQPTVAAVLSSSGQAGPYCD